MFAVTNASESYDYHYVKTVETIKDKYGKNWRVLEVSDPERFERFQRPRYESGLRQAYTAKDTGNLEFLRLTLPQ